jgi:hypothetical protein
MQTITYKTAVKKFGKQAKLKCTSFKIKSTYDVYFKLCIEGLAHQAGYFIARA